MIILEAGISIQLKILKCINIVRSQILKGFSEWNKKLKVAEL